VWGGRAAAAAGGAIMRFKTTVRWTSETIARRGTEKKALKLERDLFFFLFGGRKGCARIWEGPSGGKGWGGGSSAGNTRHDISSTCFENQGF